MACHIQIYLKIFAESAEKSGKLKSALLAIEWESSHLYSNQKMTLRSTGRRKLWSKWLLKPDAHLQNKQEKNTTAKRTKEKKQSFLQETCIQLSIGGASLPNINTKVALSGRIWYHTVAQWGNTVRKKKNLLTWHKLESNCTLFIKTFTEWSTSLSRLIHHSEKSCSIRASYSWDCPQNNYRTIQGSSRKVS